MLCCNHLLKEDTDTNISKTASENQFEQYFFQI